MTQPDQSAKLILYACPTGPLARQIDAFFARSGHEIGENSAHNFPPHVTLVGYFHDNLSALPSYIGAVTAALGRVRHSRPTPPLAITGVIFGKDFHGLTIESPWLIGVVADVIGTVDSPSRRDALRPKNWLHLSLAYEFAQEQCEPLKRLARATIDLTATVRWELRLYEQRCGGTWYCHASWPMDDPSPDDASQQTVPQASSQGE